MEQVVASGGRRTTYDARGLAEPHAEVPHVSEIDDATAVFDAAKLTTRQINLELRDLIYEQGITDVTVKNPGAKHSIGVGILQRCRIRFEGSLGYFGVGLIDGPEITITGRVGWSVCENMMSGVVRIEKNAGSLTGAALRGGDIVVNGPVGARTGIDQKGGTIIVMGSAGSMNGFMMQRGRQIICGDVGHGLGDSMYDGTIYVGGKIEDLGVDAVPGEMTELDCQWLERKLKLYGLKAPKGVKNMTKIVAGRQLWNYDNLEPSEKKLIL
jgi:glutamate synthase domain-containing protein 3